MNDAQKSWLSQYIGSDVPWKATVEKNGQPEAVDVKQLLAQLKEMDAEVAKTKEAGQDVKALEAKQKKERDAITKALEKIGLPSGFLEKAEKFEATRQKKDAALT